MTILNALLNRVFDLLMAPLRPLGAGVALALVSAVTAVVLLLVFRATSNQRAIAAVKRQIHADLFEMRLFRDELGVMLRATGGALAHNAFYLRLSLTPMLWLIVPLGLMVVQLDTYFGYVGATVGQPVLVTAQFNRPMEDLPFALEVPADVNTDAAAVRISALRQAIWRLVPSRQGDFVLRLRAGSETYDKRLTVSQGLARVSVVRASSGLLDQLLYPSEPPIQRSSPLTSIRISYPEHSYALLGWNWSWMILYFVESIVFALVLKAPLGVRI